MHRGRKRKFPRNYVVPRPDISEDDSVDLSEGHEHRDDQRQHGLGVANESGDRLAVPGHHKARGKHRVNNAANKRALQSPPPQATPRTGGSNLVDTGDLQPRPRPRPNFPSFQASSSSSINYVGPVNDDARPISSAASFGYRMEQATSCDKLKSNIAPRSLASPGAMTTILGKARK